MSDPDPPTSRSDSIFERLRESEEREVADDSEPQSDGDGTPDGSTAIDSEESRMIEDPSEAEGADDTDPDNGTDQIVAEHSSEVAVPAPADEPARVDDASPGDRSAPPVPRPVQMPEEARIEVGGLPGRDRLPELADPQPAPIQASPDRRDAAGHALPRIMAIANQKGGVGKTTTTVNLGAALAEAGYRTLVVDLDPQGNASTGLGINIRDLQLSMYDVVIHEAPIDDTIEATAMKNLFVAPSSLDLAGAEIELVPAFSRELRLRHALQSVEDDYDYVLIDCPPSLGLLTVNGLAAAAEVLVPIQCEYYALEGLGQLLRNVSLVQRNLNQSLVVSTFVCVMYDARTKLADQVVAEVRDHFGDKVCRIVIPRTVRLSEAPSYGQPILAFDPRSRGAIAYRELAREVSGGAVQVTTP